MTSALWRFDFFAIDCEKVGEISQVAAIRCFPKPRSTVGLFLEAIPRLRSSCNPWFLFKNHSHIILHDEKSKVKAEIQSALSMCMSEQQNVMTA